MTTQEPPLGSHLKSSRRGYTHHGIYVGQQRVIHYAGWANNQATGPVEETDLDSFTQGNGYSIVHHENADRPEVIVARARRRIGETDYNVASNNCEHFCNSCVNEDHHSRQVDVATAPGALTLGAAAGLAAREEAMLKERALRRSCCERSRKLFEEEEAGPAPMPLPPPLLLLPPAAPNRNAARPPALRLPPSYLS